jgi:hypothetical protein
MNCVKVRMVRCAGMQYTWESYKEYIVAGKPDDRPQAIFVNKVLKSFSILKMKSYLVN